MKYVVMLTKKYPFENGEEFIENEIKYLATQYDRIFILSCAAGESAKMTREIPANVSAYRCGDYEGKFKYFYYVLNSFKTRKDEILANEIAKEKDIRELFDLQLRAFESEAEKIGSRNVPALMESLEENRADFRNWTVLVKRNDAGRIIGAVRFREESDHIEIGRVMVAQEYRNRGVAIGLMTAVEELTQAKTFELYTCTKSYININLYEKLGYRIYKEEQGDRDLSFAYMRKTIG